MKIEEEKNEMEEDGGAVADILAAGEWHCECFSGRYLQKAFYFAFGFYPSAV